MDKSFTPAPYPHSHMHTVVVVDAKQTQTPSPYAWRWQLCMHHMDEFIGNHMWGYDDSRYIAFMDTGDYCIPCERLQIHGNVEPVYAPSPQSPVRDITHG